MPRPRKPRIVNGAALADNLYPDNKGRPNHYRYRRADGSFRGFSAPSVEVANQLAIEANALRDTVTPQGKPAPGRDQLAYYAPLYIAYRERIDPAISGKPSWRNRAYAIHQAAEHFNSLPIGKLDWGHLQSWWDALTPAQQKLRHAEFRRWFNWLMAQGLLPRLDYNPFTTADDRPRLILKQTPTKRRQPLTLDGYWRIYHAAGDIGYHALQIAMGISLYTTYRREDIVTLRWDEHLRDRTLRLVIGKSESQKGTARAARHEWDLDRHPLLAQLINRARELSLKNQRCPYIISHTPERRQRTTSKDHYAQVTPERLTRMFSEAAAAAASAAQRDGQPQLARSLTATTFHEVRGLSSALHRLAGYSTEEIQSLMAHENKSTTLGYQDGHELPYSRMEMTLPDGVLGGSF